MADDKKNETREFTREFLLEALIGLGGVEVMENRVVVAGDWLLSYDFVFKYEDTFYSAPYSVGATETQDEAPWENDDDPVKVYVVHPVEVTVTEYQ